MDKLYIVIPAYNEQDNIEDVVKDWYPVVEKTGAESRLVIIDDGSKDATYEKLQELAKDRPQLEAIHKENGGHGATVLYGYRYAIDKGATYIFQTDSDGQTLPSEFDEFWKQREDYDMVIGHRKGRQDGFSRVVVTKVLKAVCLLCFHVNVQDANTPFRLMKAESLKKEIGLIPQDYNLSNVVVSVLFIKKGYKVKYLPITFRPRQGGVNSINLKKIAKIGQKAVKDFIQINKIIKVSK
ncbi:MAG: glycosyltransferase family 2 protein [Lachnospiraceae bacterium]|nr:glycosyltransferase family 2 protein [Lachnospiraceae bacterium]MBP3567529.1 glycosyltransferase family 2 protein [Lachnospiraceae bacterium]